MTPKDYQALCEVAYLVGKSEAPASNIWYFVTQVGYNVKQGRKEALFRDVIARLANEIDLNINLELTRQCPVCLDHFEVPKKGRPKQFCDDRCRKRRSRARSKL